MICLNLMTELMIELERKKMTFQLIQVFGVRKNTRRYLGNMEIFSFLHLGTELRKLLKRMELDPYTNYQVYAEYEHIKKGLDELRSNQMEKAVDSLKQSQYNDANLLQENIWIVVENRLGKKGRDGVNIATTGRPPRKRPPKHI